MKKKLIFILCLGYGTLLWGQIEKGAWSVLQNHLWFEQNTSIPAVALKFERKEWWLPLSASYNLTDQWAIETHLGLKYEKAKNLRFYSGTGATTIVNEQNKTSYFGMKVRRYSIGMSKFYIYGEFGFTQTKDVSIHSSSKDVNTSWDFTLSPGMLIFLNKELAIDVNTNILEVSDGKFANISLQHIHSLQKKQDPKTYSKTQLHRNNWLVGSTMQLNSAKYNYLSSTNAKLALGLEMNVGYFLLDNWLIGASVKKEAYFNKFTYLLFHTDYFVLLHQNTQFVVGGGYGKIPGLASTYIPNILCRVGINHAISAHWSLFFHYDKNTILQILNRRDFDLTINSVKCSVLYFLK